QGDRPPRPQAAQRAADGGRRAEGDRLRAGQAGRREPGADGAGRLLRHADLHVSRAGAGQLTGPAGRQGFGRVGAGGDPVPGGGGAVGGRQAGGEAGGEGAEGRRGGGGGEGRAGGAATSGATTEDADGGHDPAAEGKPGRGGGPAGGHGEGQIGGVRRAGAAGE